MASATASADTSAPEAPDAPDRLADDVAPDRWAEREVSRAAGPRLAFRLLRWSVVAIHRACQEGVLLTQEEQTATRGNRGAEGRRGRYVSPRRSPGGIQHRIQGVGIRPTADGRRCSRPRSGRKWKAAWSDHRCGCGRNRWPGIASDAGDESSGIPVPVSDHFGDHHCGQSAHEEQEQESFHHATTLPSDRSYRRRDPAQRVIAHRWRASSGVDDRGEAGDRAPIDGDVQLSG